MSEALNGEATVLTKIVKERWSCRGFRRDPVPHETIESILDIARASPSWCNTQPWHLHITESEGTDRFRQALTAQVGSVLGEEPDLPFPEAYEGKYLERRRASGWQLYEAVGVARGDRAASAAQILRNFTLFDAPHVAIVTTDANLGLYGAVDCGLFIQTFLLAAHSLGVSTVAQAAIATQSPFVRKYFDLPADRKVLAGISFGFAAEGHPANDYRTPRQEIVEMVTWC